MQWLQNREFVEYVGGQYRLDDVARDIFRGELWREDRALFQTVNQQLADHFQTQAKAEVFPDSSPRQQYENNEWCRCFAENLYYRLYGGKQESLGQLINSWLESLYFRKPQLLAYPILWIQEEIDLTDDRSFLLSNAIKRDLIEIGQLDNTNTLPFHVEFEFKNFLVGAQCYKSYLSKFAEFCWLLIQSETGLSDKKLAYLKQAKEQAEKLKVTNDADFLTDLYLWKLGYLFYALQAYEEALAAFDQALQLKPDFYEAWNNRGIALGNLGKHEEELAAFEQALKLKPDFYEAWNNRGIALGNLGRHEEALVAFDQVLKIKLDDHQAWINRGFALQKLGRYEEAITAYDQVLQLKPDFHEACYGRGIALGNLSRYEASIDAFNQALRLKPDFHEALNHRGVALSKLDRYEEALVAFDQVLKIKPDDHQAWNNRGVGLGNLGKYEEAITAYDQALKIKDDHQAWNNRGVALGNLGKYEEAITAYDQALKIKDDHQAWNNRGVALQNLGRHEAAAQSYQKAMEINPNDAVVHYNLACLFALQDNIDLSLNYLAKAIALNPENRTRASTDAAFDSIRHDRRFAALLQ